MNSFWKVLIGKEFVEPYDKKLIQNNLQQKKIVGTDYLGRTNPVYYLGNNSINWDDNKNDAYSTNAVVYSVVNYIVNASKQVPYLVYTLDKNGDKQKVVDDHPLTNLLYRPNPKQTFGELMEGIELDLLTTGNAYLWANKVSRKRIAELWALDPKKVEVIGGGRMQEVTGYRVALANGDFLNYKPEDVVHFKYANPNDSRYGLSPIAAGYKLVKASDAGIEARVKQYENNGPQGILYSDDNEVEAPDAVQVQSIKDKIKSFFSSPNRFEVPFVPSKIKYIKLGDSLVDLKVLEALDADKNGICDLYRFPGHLLNGQNGSTYNNVGEASKGLYTKCVIPLKRQIQEKLNLFLTKDFDDKVFVDIDQSEVAELQADKLNTAEWLAKCPWITINQKQKIMGVEVDKNLQGKYEWDMIKKAISTTVESDEEAESKSVINNTDSEMLKLFLKNILDKLDKK